MLPHLPLKSRKYAYLSSVISIIPPLPKHHPFAPFPTSICASPGSESALRTQQHATLRVISNRCAHPACTTDIALPNWKTLLLRLGGKTRFEHIISQLTMFLAKRHLPLALVHRTSTTAEYRETYEFLLLGEILCLAMRKSNSDVLQHPIACGRLAVHETQALDERARNVIPFLRQDLFVLLRGEAFQRWDVVFLGEDVDECVGQENAAWGSEGGDGA